MIARTWRGATRAADAEAYVARGAHILSRQCAIGNSRCRAKDSPSEGAINTVGLDLGVSEAGRFAWAVFGPANGMPYGALGGEYVGASGDIGIGVGAGANVLVGGSNRSVALQPVSLEGSVGLNVVAGLSQLKLRPVPH